MTVKMSTLPVSTRAGMHIVEITSEVQEAVRSGGLTNGIVTVFVPGSTGALTTVEYEPGLVRDLDEFWERLIPSDTGYHHDMTWHDGNGHAHLRASLLGPSLTIPFADRTLTLGTWQQVVFIDFDVPARQRRLIVQQLGE